jgi:hypothetical protein
MKQISFTYYAAKVKGTKSKPGDGDINAKIAALTNIPGTAYTGQSVSKICREALEDWLPRALANPTIAPSYPPFLPPIASINQSISFSFDPSDYDIRAKVKELIEADGSAYRLMTPSRVYVIGINAWLDQQLAMHASKSSAAT